MRNILKNLKKTKTQTDKFLLEKYITIFNQSPIAIELYDSNGSLINANTACINLFGVINKNEISGFKLFEDPNISEDVKSKLLNKETVKFQTEFNFEEVKRLHLYRSNCSGIKTMDITITPLIQNNLVIGYIAQIQDITEQKIAENALIFNNILLFTQQESLNDGILVVNENGKILSFNQRFIKMWDIPSEIIETKSDSIVLQSIINKIKDSKEFIDKVNFLYEAQTEICTDEIILNDNRIFERYTSPMIDTVGKYYGRLWNFRDITERKLAEKKLQESEEKFSIAFKTSTYSIVITNPSDGKILEANEAFYSVTGYDKNDIDNSTIDLWENPEDRDKVIQELQKTGKVSSIEVNFKTKSGGQIIALYSGNIISIKGKSYILSSINNITDIKLSERENTFLQEQIYQTDKMDSIGVLAGGIAHDFNNLLMAVQGNASLMSLNIDKNDKNYERILSIEDQVQSGSSLTKQLLGFARGGKYESKITNMNKIIKQSSKMFNRTKKEITINYELEGTLWNVDVDHGQMDQVLMNLYINAGQAMPGGGEIFIQTKNKIIREKNGVPAGKYVEIKIKDVGTGMDEKTRLRIFEPFFTTKEMGRGTGLGLASVYGIIKNHNGIIYAESKIGEGTTFIIYLPASDREVIKTTKKDRMILRGTETILTIDDEKHILRLNKDLLEHIGYTVFTAGSGQEGLATYMEKKDKIDLIILDMIMPGLSGGTTFDKLREINPNVKVILSSGYSLNGDATDIMNRGCSGFIQKPFLLEELSQKVREILEE